MANLLLYGDTERSAALRHEIPIAIIDPLVYAELDGRAFIQASLLGRAEAVDGTLHVDGQPLVAESVRAALRAACEALGAPTPPDVIVASVWQGVGHDPGSGPLPAGLPIQIDLWPRDEASGCWA